MRIILVTLRKGKWQIQSGRSCAVPCGQVDRRDVSHSLYSLSKL